MKHLLLVVALMCTTQGFTQLYPLEDLTWSLESLDIDGISYNVPISEEILLSFNEDLPGDFNFETIVCQSAHSEVSYDDLNSSFSFVQPLEISGTQCESGSELEEFEPLYFNFFLNDIDFPFEYEIYIIDFDGYLLVIKSESENYATYSEKHLGVEDQKLADITLYPNPVNDLLTISCPNNEILKTEVYDVEGKKVKDFKNSGRPAIEIDLSGLKSGLYFVAIYSDSGQITKKIIKK